MVASSSSSTEAAVYTDAQLQQALNSLYQDSSEPDHDARHIFGYHDKNHKLSMLQRIHATRILDYENKKQQGASVPSIEELIAQAHIFRQQHGPTLNLKHVIQSQAPRMALAAEFKRASPSKGDIATHLKAGEQASKYAVAGANIISCLTEPRWFQGSLEDLTEVRLHTAAAVEQRPAVLAKEFIYDEYMIADAAAAGADTVLLIVAVLPQHRLQRLIDFCRSLDMEPLVEVHTDIELDVALDAGAKVIGINNRNLHTFQMDLATSERVADQLVQRQLAYHHDDPCSDYVLCALSGMSNALDVDRFRQVGIGMCLIGESLMRANDPGQAIQGLLLHPDDFRAASTSTSVGGAYTGGLKVVKVCGVTNPEDALVACRAGANLIGVIFAEKSKRRVDQEQAQAVVRAVQQFGERQRRHAFARPKQELSPLQHLVWSSQQLEQATRRPLVVGVFQNQDMDFVRETAIACDLDMVQLHGDEGFAAASQCGVPALRVVDIVVDPATGQAADKAVESILEQLTNDPIAVLLDTAIKGQASGGGTSVAFDWNIAQRVQEAGLPVLIAGGLSADTVSEAVLGTRPFGVDVSSGVEASPGVKDHAKTTAFVQNARVAAVEASKGF